jgi:hypothetical protein
MMHLMNTAEAAERYDKTRRWASLQAKKHAKTIEYQGQKWPIKVGSYWVAPIEVWDRIYELSKKTAKSGRPRKRKN